MENMSLITGSSGSVPLAVGESQCGLCLCEYKKAACGVHCLEQFEWKYLSRCTVAG